MGDKIKYSIKNVHYATFTDESSAEYNTPKAMPGAVALSLEPTGESTPFYADGVVYFRSVSNTGYEAELEITYVQADFLKDIFGYTEGGTSKVLTENANKISKPFALLCEEEGDESGTKYVFYKCTATRPKRSFKTKEENIQAQTQTLSIQIEPMINGDVYSMTQDTTPQETVQNWYTKVFKEGEE